MKRIGNLTFHASHNYGSCLQAYALAKAFEKVLGQDGHYQNINYRSKKQSDMYRNIFAKHDKKSLYSRLFFVGQKKALDAKYQLFEKFIAEKLPLTEKIDEERDLGDTVKSFDTLVVGSDQVWNLRAKDFSWAYFLPFATDKPKFSYAPSIGPKNLELTQEETKQIADCLCDFTSISVRDERTKETVKACTDKPIEIVPDPTLLLKKEDWLKLLSDASSKPNIEKPYLLFYDLSRDKKRWSLAKKIAKAMHLMPVITSVPFPRVIHHSLGFHKAMATGPVEFLWLLYHADFVISSSFHGCVFSSLFGKPFVALPGSSGDFRIDSFLKQVGLLERKITDIAQFDSAKFLCVDDIVSAQAGLEELRLSGVKYIERIAHGDMPE